MVIQAAGDRLALDDRERIRGRDTWHEGGPVVVQPPVRGLWIPHCRDHPLLRQPGSYRPTPRPSISCAHETYRRAIPFHSMGHRAGLPASYLLSDGRHGCRLAHQGLAISQGEAFRCRSRTAREMRGSVGVSADWSDGTGSSECPCSATHSDTDIIVYKD